MSNTSVTIQGNLVADPEVAVFEKTNSQVVRFRVAVNEVINTRQGQREVTSYFTCEAWNGLGGNVLDSFHKGDHLVVTGELRQDRWEQEVEGGEPIKRERVKIHASNVGASTRFTTVKLPTNEGADMPAAGDAETGAEPF